MTGGTGFIGRRALARLAAGAREVLATARDLAAVPAVPGVSWIQADLAPGPSALLAARLGSVDAVVHLAAAVPGRGGNAPASAEAGNLRTVATVLDALRPAPRRFALISSVDVYGVPVRLPVDEDHPLAPVTPYGVAKLAAERLVAERAAAAGFEPVILRLTQVYGPGEPELKVIPSWIGRLVRGEAPVLYGDGTELRDYLYVDDAVDALALALEGSATGVFNVASGTSVSLLEVLAALEHVWGAPIRVERRPRTRPALDLAMDVTRIREAFGFRPSVSLEEGLSRQLEDARRRG